jgi:hypothetical protein
MRNVLVAILACVMVFVTLGASAEASTPCHEDEPCWVWSKHGNKQRGVDVDGKRLVVKPCTYAELARTHQLDSTTAPLRGDWWARMICKFDSKG